MTLFLIGFVLYSTLSVTAQSSIDTSLVLSHVTVLYDTDDWTISPMDSLAIDSLARVVVQRPGAYFEVEGHTDDVGSSEYNLELSRKRMESVRQILLQGGVDSTIIRFAYHGEYLPETENDSDASRQQNRRTILKWQYDHELFPLIGVIRDRETKEGIEAEIELKARDYRQVTTSDSLGNFVILTPIEEVEIEVFAENYFMEVKKVRVNPDSLRRPLDLQLPRLGIGKHFIMERLLFVGNKSILLQPSREELPRIRKFMLKNTRTCIEIAGHINWPSRPAVSEDTREYQLSVARALEIYDYLLEAGVEPQRIVAKGYGNWEMLFPKARNEIHQRRNRRVEIRIVDCERSATEPNDTIFNRDYFRTEAYSVDRGQYRIDKRLDDKLVRQLEKIHQRDQIYRERTRDLARRFGPKSAEAHQNARSMLRADAANLIEVAEILEDRGWPSLEEAGPKGATTIFLVIQHAPVEAQEKYLPMVRQAVSDGALAARHLAVLEDQVHLHRTGYQIYGSQIGETGQGQYFVYPVEDPGNLDRRRAAMGMPPMEQYLKVWGIDW